jgi:thiol-disulfide isomerase/thioredoxin
MQTWGRRIASRALTGLVVLLAVSLYAEHSLLVPAQDKKPAPSAGDGASDAKKSDVLKPADIPPSTYIVPTKGNAKDYLRFIHRIEALRPEFDAESDAEQFLIRSRNATLSAAEKGLASKPNSEQEMELLKSKLEAYQVLLIVGAPDILPKALKFADSLKRDKRPVLAELGEAAWLDFKIATVPTVGSKERLSIVNAMAAALAKKPQTYVQFAMELGRILEGLGDGATAAAAYEAFGSVLSKNLDENIRALGQKMKTGGVRRARLLSGEPLKVSGTTVDGKRFDIDEYKGKVVVVDFWATWCGPCIEELPNLKAVYDKYHGRGLEVVGISLDDEKDLLTKFIKQNGLPWKILFSSDPKKTGFSEASADYYGISGIPAIFVMNRQGKVVSLNARGPELAALVQKLVEPAESK